MSWFRRVEKGIVTPTDQKKETPDGLWHKCPECKAVTNMADHKHSLYTCPKCSYHSRINSAEYFEILFDDNHFHELDNLLSSADPLSFADTQPYPQRIAASQKKTKLQDAVRIFGGQGVFVLLRGNARGHQSGTKHKRH
jgi:acetyl-CoA carboxylase carboxyl transferase subunit beta